ncbi:MAG: hypothetical protein Fur007_19640 [Rhodoferax sp.]
MTWGTAAQAQAPARPNAAINAATKAATASASPTVSLPDALLRGLPTLGDLRLQDLSPADQDCAGRILPALKV